LRRGAAALAPTKISARKRKRANFRIPSRPSALSELGVHSLTEMDEASVFILLIKITPLFFFTLYLCFIMIQKEAYTSIKQTLAAQNVQLIAVSKTKPIADIQELLDLGQLDFGENYVQELLEKQAALPSSINWHFIGHLQTNKVKDIAPFVYLIHGVDSERLLQEINKQAVKNNRVIKVLLQVHIAQEETKFGLDAEELIYLVEKSKGFQNVQIVGLMGMASNSTDSQLVGDEFRYLHTLFTQLNTSYPELNCTVLSMGMSGDYLLAVQSGSTMVRIGSLLFGARNYSM
jgi:PLP dependent protein